VIRRDPVEHSPHHQSDSDSRPTCELVVDHVPAVAVVGTMGALLLPVCPAAHRVQMAPANDPQALPSLRVVAVHLALVSLAQMAKLRRAVELLSRPEAHVLLCHVRLAKAVAWRLPQPDSPQQPATDCRLLAQPHELAAEHSWDFLF
jgi:hypothetical protein